MATKTVSWAFALALFPALSTVAQQTPSAGIPASQTVRLNVEVETKSGEPVSGLKEQDFKLLDNGAPKNGTSFKEVSSGQEQVEVIVLIDAVNANFDTAAYARDQLQKFLASNGGKLGQPTTIAVLTDKGVQGDKGFSTDGNALRTALDQNASGLREINRAAGFWGATERLQICLDAVRQIGQFSAGLPGRKIVLWISPGWPLLSGPRTDLDEKEERQIFGDVVSLSTQLREANVTIFNINPQGAGENLMRADYYEEFLKGVSKPSQVNIGDLSLQVLSVQSGGLALVGNTDVAGLLVRCLKDVQTWYEISFPAAVPEKPNEYHHIEVKVDRPGVTVRTRDGYYAQP
jgi:VWFA-related protein